MILSKKIHRLFNVLATLLLTLSTLIGGAGAVVSASTVNDITGLSAGDAKVTDSSGKDVTGWGNLNKFSDYNVHYNWSIPDETPVNNGDTATFTLPSNVQLNLRQDSPGYQPGEECRFFGVVRRFFFCFGLPALLLVVR